MKNILVFILVISCVGCVRDVNELIPDHICVTPAMEWEMEKGQHTKRRPRVEMCLDWNLKANDTN